MRLTIAIFIISLYVNSSIAQYNMYDTDAFFNAAIELASNEKYEEAIKSYEKVHSADPRYLEACESIATIHYIKEKPADGISVLLPLYDADRFKEYPSLYVIFGTLYSENEELDKSEAVYKEGEIIIPQYAALHYNKAILYVKKESPKKAIESLKKAITYNPNYVSAHYLLSTIAFDNGQLGLGALASLAYLANAPNGRYNSKAITALNTKMGSNYLEETDLKFSDSGDDFSNLDLILRGEFALNKKYKLDCDIDDTYTRQVQAIVEYAEDHQLKDGFFENIYIPYLKDIAAKKQTTNFNYWTLQALTGDIGKKLMKHKKEMLDYQENYYQKYFWEIYSVRKQNHFGVEKMVNVFISDGIPYLVCELINGELDGFGRYLDEFSRTEGKVLYKNGIAEGKAIYYDSDGDISEDRMYRNDKKNGVNNYYRKGGILSSRYNYTDGKLDGTSSTFYNDGTIKCSANYVDGELHGDYICLYPDGSKDVKLGYKEGKADGERIDYYPNGNLKAKEIFKDGLYNGTNTYFDINGNETSNIKYANGEVTTSYVQKDRSGKSDYELIINGDKKLSKSYNAGKLYSTDYYDKDDLEKTEFFKNDKLYATYTYKNDKLSEVKQYTRDAPKGKKLDVNNHKLFDYEGNLLASKKFRNGVLHGINTYYYLNGNKRSELSYKNGMEDGQSNSYDIYGQLKSNYIVVNDTLQGLYSNYKNGYKTSETFYKDGEPNGPFKNFHQNGKVSRTGFYLNGIQMGNEYVYWESNGDLKHKYTYKGNKIQDKEYFDSKGGVEQITDYTKDGKKEQTLKTIAIKNKFTLKNGEVEGRFVRLDSSNDTIFNLQFLYGKQHGRNIYYSPSNVARFTCNIFQGKCEGKAIFLDHLGNSYSETMYINDDQHGPETYFYPNGKKHVDMINKNDFVHGEQIIYNMQGDVLANLHYDNGMLVKYKLIGQSKEIFVDNSAQILEGKYADGNNAIKLSFLKRVKNGTQQIWNPQGNLIYIETYKNGLFDGERKYFHPNGKAYCTINYQKNNRNGDTVFYDENGNIVLKYTSKHGSLQGPYEIYKNGKISTTKIYRDDQIIQIK